MENSSTWIAWKNSTGGYTISDRIASSHDPPTLSSAPASTIVPLRVPAPDWATMAFSFIRPIKTNDAHITATSLYIYALGKRAPATNIDSPVVALRGHPSSDCGSLGILDFASLPDPAPTPGSSGNSYCKDQLFCIYGKPDGNGNIVFTLHSAAPGWAAIGTGDSMDDSYITVGWKNSTGGHTISDRYASDTSLPPPVDAISREVSLQVPAPDWAALSFSFRRPIASSNFTVAKDTHFIYAYATRPPKQIDSPTSSFYKHSAYGVLGPLDFVSEGPSTVPTSATSTTGSATTASSTAAQSGTPTPTPDTNGNSTSVCVPNTFCVIGEPDGQGNVLFTLYSAAPGWVALGVGPGMSRANMMIGWKNPAGGYVLSDRTSSDEVMPALSGKSTSKLVDLRHPAPSWASLAFTISRPMQASDYPIT
ncbi:hypothetical protein HDU91_002698, partial [Kappamyces sp. JEL0680]